jgi:type VI secretion system secreted protein Hcp
VKSGLFKLFGALVLVAIATGATIALAGSLSDSTTINACIEKNGKVNIYPPPKACPADQTPLSWNVQGPAGATGPQGQKGEQGPAGSAPASPDAIAGTLSAHGLQQGNFGTGLEITGVSHEIVSPRDAASGQATGKRQHKPFTITKKIDKSSPLFLRSIFTNETLTSVLIGLLLPSGETMATVELENTHVTDRQQHGDTETISFVYQKITWIWTDGNVTAEDDWEIQNS